MEVRRPARAGPVSHRTAPDDPTGRGDPVGALAALAVPLDLVGAGARAMRVGRELVATPARAAFTTAWGFALVIAVACLFPSSRTTLTVSGPASVRCGLDVFLYGYPDPAVARVCRSAEATRLALFVPALLFVVLGILIAVLGAARRSEAARQRWSRVRAGIRRSPAKSSLMILGLLGVPALLWSIRPAPAYLATSGTIKALACGPDSYFFAFPDQAVKAACAPAYAPRAHVLVGAGSVILVGLGVAALSSIRVGSGRRERMSRAMLWGAVLLVVGAIALLWPLSVEVNIRGQTFLARCALDSYLTGYPVPTVQSTCRARFAPHIAEGGALVALASVSVLARRAFFRSGARTTPRMSRYAS